MDITLMVTFITALAAIITALAAVISPVLTALINNHGAYRLKFMELFFEAKAKAYLEFLDISSNFPKNPQESMIIELYAALNHALLFSTEDTRSKLSLYATLLIEPPADNKLFALAYQEALLAMQSELRKYRKHH